ncbi:MAG: hypothetical protein K8R53_12025, partial [Bacteroidales bacterium]|nr:hypothetical protein [Bacteroidales bacterium]
MRKLYSFFAPIRIVVWVIIATLSISLATAQGESEITTSDPYQHVDSFSPDQNTSQTVERALADILNDRSGHETNNWMNNSENITWTGSGSYDSWTGQTGMYSCFHPNKWSEGGIYYPYTSSDEVIHFRTENSKTFRNPDGSFTAVFLSNLHYIDANGSWKDVDLALKANTTGKFAAYNLCNTTNNFSTFIDTDGSEGIVFEKDGFSVNFSRNSHFRLSNNAPYSKTGSYGQLNGQRTVDFKNITSGIDQELVLLKRGIEHGTIIQNKESLQNGSILFSEEIVFQDSWKVIANGQVKTGNFTAEDFYVI